LSSKTCGPTILDNSEEGDGPCPYHLNTWDTTTVSKAGLEESIINDFQYQAKVQTYEEVQIVAQTIILFHKV
jgi:hypothetical protein